MEEAKKRTEDNKRRRLTAQAEKQKEKALKRGTKQKAKTPLQEPVTSASDMPQGSSGFSLTQEKLVHGLSPVLRNLDPVPDIDECILNLSIGSLPNGTEALENVTAFLEMVMTLLARLSKL